MEKLAAFELENFKELSKSESIGEPPQKRFIYIFFFSTEKRSGDPSDIKDNVSKN